MGIEIVHFLPEDRWRSFVEDHPAGSIFHTPEMFNLFSRVSRHTPTLWAAINSDGDPLVLFIPVRITLLGPPFSRATTRAVSFADIICAPSVEATEAVEVLLHAYVENVGEEILFTEIRNLSETIATQETLSRCGFRFEDHINYLIHLDGTEEEIAGRFSRRLRQTIRQGIRRGDIETETAQRSDQIRICHKLVERTCINARIPPPDYSLFDAAFRVLSPKGMIRFCLARVGSEYVAASVDLLYRNGMYAWYSGTDRAYRSYAPGEMVMWDVLTWGARNGYTVFDFGGAGKPEEPYGVRDFKARFGGDLVNFGRNVHVHAPMRLRISKQGYRLYRLFIR